tara:strand:- start:171 stop:398 length:228 start_codon:yes stop_codon:yes gene_type:complete
MPSVDEIKEVVAEIVDAEPADIQLETDLYSFESFDSVEVLSLLVALNDIGVSVDQGQISSVVTFGDLLKVSGVES